MGSVSSSFDSFLFWTPALITGVAVAAAGSYFYAIKGGGCPMMNRACCSTSGGEKGGVEKGREKDIVDDINPKYVFEANKHTFISIKSSCFLYLDRYDHLPRFTLEQLKECDGKEKNKNLYIAIQGLVYDVGAHEAGRHFYGPGGSYALFAGKEATTALAKMGLEESLLNQPPSSWSSFSDDEKKCICSWAKKLAAKYPLAGVVDFGAEGVETAAAWREEIAKLQC